jgi:hypothetical protein
MDRTIIFGDLGNNCLQVIAEMIPNMSRQASSDDV